MREKKRQAPSADPSDAAARIRNNQRRSRARHREFVNELKAKIREYEQQGVQATLEMRQAARKVALENARLRSLLASCGVSAAQVDHYLASFDDRESGNLPMPTLTPQTSNAGPLPLATDSRWLHLDRDWHTGASASALDTLATAVFKNLLSTSSSVEYTIIMRPRLSSFAYWFSEGEEAKVDN
ncbi:b5e770e3-ee4e-4a3d-8d25-bc88b3d64abd [Thermothielavioides terrestris]|uniref:B5e770e3-ee4e-4a3d-8d25-bc88b3d64abd n=1 Tax=Thermothielavioides terrestris TaxID=2587410 RepID=A0A3S5CXR1_9PEZI|nr:b5e770e3-ee4e-4a3d-8d25-bc88b3d64abd [Thermothielavioides terrestris]